MAWSDAFSPRNRFGETDAEVNWRIAQFGDIDPSTGGHVGRSPNETPWGQYGRVLAARGAQLNPRANPAEPGLPSGYTQGQLDKELGAYHERGQLPRFAGSTLLPGSQARIRGSMAALLGRK